MLALEGKKVMAFDFDGVLVDSYSIIPKIYRDIGRYYLNLNSDQLNNFVKDMLEGEELHDLGLLGSRNQWWPLIFMKYVENGHLPRLEEVANYYWDNRIRGSRIIPNVPDTLSYLIEKGFKLVIVCSRDDIPGQKLKRIEKSGLIDFFDEVLIVGENVKTRHEAVIKIIRKYTLSHDELVIVDDKVPPLLQVQELNTFTIKVDFNGPIKKAWILPINPDLRIKTIADLKNLI